MRRFSFALLISAFLFGPSMVLAGPPDILYWVCVDTNYRAQIRAERSTCDDRATSGQMGPSYNVGIFRPCNPQDEINGQTDACNICLQTPDQSIELYLCAGAPGSQE